LHLLYFTFTIALMTSMPLLAITDLTYAYGSHRALKSVSLSVNAGECFGLLGPNGAGKTTLLSIISCLREAQSGSVTLNGQPLNPDNIAVRSQLGIAPQEIAVYPSLTARENLLFFGRLYHIPEQTLVPRVQQLLEAMGLASKADARVETFSGGMQRRINLATALVHQPTLLLLDEPTAGVDPQSRALLFDEVRRCSRDGMTIIYTTHYMEEVEALCSRVAIIDHGQVVANDTLQNLLKQVPARVEITLAKPDDRLRAVLSSMEGMTLESSADAHCVAIQSTGSADLLTRVVQVIGQLGLETRTVKATTPSLERVFLQLTGRALRD
jgi:ABC-2 type transport system ATP-binding protein